MNLRIVVDIMLTAALLLSMAYLLIGIDNHEIAGTAFFILSAAHIALNRRWFKNVFKGKYSLTRFFRAALNLSIFAAVIGLLASGLIFATYTPAFIKTAFSVGIARQVHLAASYWCFVLLSVHIGTNLSALFKAAGFKNKYREIFRFIGIVSACCGVFAFAKHDLPSYMLLRQEFVFFDMKQPLALFFAEYISIMSFCGMIGWSIMRALAKLDKRKNLCAVKKMKKMNELEMRE